MENARAQFAGLSCEKLNDNLFLANIMESEMKYHIRIIEAEESLGANPLRTIPNMEVRNEEAVCKWLELVGFRFRSSDHWIKMGISQASCSVLQ